MVPAVKATILALGALVPHAACLDLASALRERGTQLERSEGRDEMDAAELRPRRARRRDGASLREAGSVISGWEHRPSSPPLLLVTGGTRDLYEDENFGSATSAIMLAYARRHGYGLYVHRDIGSLSTRRMGWNKIPLLLELMPEAPLLAWVDSDIVLENISAPLHELLNSSTCDAVEQSKWTPFLQKNSTKDTFLWLSADVVPERYLVNVNGGVMVLRAGELAERFLNEVWHVGEHPRYFEHHNDPWAWAATGPDDPNYGWPWEQGAIWDILASEPQDFLAGTCVAPVGTLQSVRPFMWSEGQFARHCSTMSHHARRKVARQALANLLNQPKPV